MSDTSPPPSRKELGAGVTEFIAQVDLYQKLTDEYLKALSNDAFYNDHTNGDIARLLDRVARLRFELIELQRKLQ